METVRIESLKFENLSFAFENQDPLFTHVEFDFPMNQIVWLKGMSGTGRSTLLQLLAGIQNPTTGKYLINGENVTDMSFEEFLPYRLSIGYSFDYGGLIHNRSLYENLILPLAYHNLVDQAEAHQRAEYYLNYFGLYKQRDMRPSLVQGGVRKLTCVMRALIHHPHLVLLDDPSVGLGQEQAYKLADLLHLQRKEGFAEHIFMSSFDEKFMSLFDYEVIHIDEGHLYHEQMDPELKKVVHL